MAKWTFQERIESAGKKRVARRCQASVGLGSWSLGWRADNDATIPGAWTVAAACVARSKGTHGPRRKGGAIVNTSTGMTLKQMQRHQFAVALDEYRAALASGSGIVAASIRVYAARFDNGCRKAINRVFRETKKTEVQP